MEIPIDLIKQVQISLRKHANLSSYDPDDPSLPNLPSPEEAVAALDSSPPYLRCRHCKGRLLRGVQSLICVFCGQEAFNGVVPDPLNFRNTLGYRWLLESLNLDGSETVAPPGEVNNSQRGRTAPKDELPLSDLLNLEIKWPSELEKFGSRLSKETPVQSKSSLNLSGVNIENFFAQKEKGASSNVSAEPSVSINQIDGGEIRQGHEIDNLFESAKLSGTFHGNLSLFENAKPSETGPENLTLFENAQPSKTSVSSTESESKNLSDSGWGADFQSAASATPHKDSTSFDPFVGSTDLSTHMDEVFGPAKDSIGKKDEETVGSASMTSDWFVDDGRKNSNSGLNSSLEDFKTTANVNNENVVGNVNYSSSTDVDWLQDNRWQSNSKNEPGSKADEENDSFDDWNDFASSTVAQDPSNTTWKQTTMPSNDKTSEIKLFSSDGHSQDINFSDSFPQPDLFSGVFSSPNASTEGNKMLPEASVFDRSPDANTKVGGNSEDVAKAGDDYGAETTFKGNDVETLLSQMHDLSFMLESNLSIPPTQQGSNSKSQD